MPKGKGKKDSDYLSTAELIRMLENSSGFTEGRLLDLIAKGLARLLTRQMM